MTPQRVLVVSANLGGFDEPVAHVPQEGVDVSYHAFTDANFPPRRRAMTPRLQAKIPKMFAWDLIPDYDAYLWLDASLQLSLPGSVAWFLAQMGTRDIAVFRHPTRLTIADEADFLRTKMAHGSRYIVARYLNEDLDGQMKAIGNAKGLRLFAAGAFIYKPTALVQAAMKDWWVQTSRFHLIDQLAFPFALHTWGINPAVIDEDIYHASHLTFTRAKGHG